MLEQKVLLFFKQPKATNQQSCLQTALLKCNCTAPKFSLTEFCCCLRLSPDAFKPDCHPTSAGLITMLHSHGDRVVHIGGAARVRVIADIWACLPLAGPGPSWAWQWPKLFLIYFMKPSVRAHLHARRLLTKRLWLQDPEIAPKCVMILFAVSTVRLLFHASVFF